MKLCYIAGPYRAATESGVKENIDAAWYMASMVVKHAGKHGWFPVTPHLNSQFMGGLADDDYWIEGDLQILKHCNAVLLLPNWDTSRGTLREKEFAKARGIPIFLSYDHFHFSMIDSSNNRPNLGGDIMMPKDFEVI